MTEKDSHTGFKSLRALALTTNLRSRPFFVASVLAIGASLCEAGVFALLVPLTSLLLERKNPASGSISQIVPSLESSDAMTQVVIFGVGVTAFATFKAIATYFSSVLVAVQVRNFAAKLRSRLMARYLGFGKLFFDTHSQGHLQQLLTTYVTEIAHSLSSLHHLLSAIFMLVAYLLVMIWISLPLTLAAIGIAPPLYFSLKWILSKIRRSSDQYVDSYNTLSRHISNVLMGIPLIKAVQCEVSEAERFAKMSSDVAGHEIAIDRKGLLMGPLQELLLVLFIVALTGLIGVYLSNNPDVAAAPLVVFLLVLKRAVSQTGVFNAVFAGLAGISGPARELLEMFNDKEKYPVISGDREINEVLEQIEIRDLSFQYPDGIRALDSVSLKFPIGTTTALVGQSGSGKSTLLNLLMCYYQSPRNSIFIDGEDLCNLKISSWLNLISFVSQDVYLFNASLRENLLYGITREISESELLEVVRRAQLTSLVEDLPRGLETQMGDRGAALSGGERQRVSIARALLRDAPIVLLDEPTSALDCVTEEKLQEAFQELLKGRTTLIVAHRLSTIRRADFVYVFEGGRIIQSGSPSMLRQNPGPFLTLWEAQSAP